MSKVVQQRLSWSQRLSLFLTKNDRFVFVYLLDLKQNGEEKQTIYADAWLELEGKHV